VILDGEFDDLLAANRDYSEQFAERGLAPIAARHVAVVTCMDSRIDVLRILGLDVGDVAVLRNAGGRVTDDVLHTLVLASHLLDVKRVLVMAHTKCRMAQSSQETLHALIKERSGVDTRSLDFATVPDQEAALRHDLVRLRAFPYFSDDTAFGGAIYDVDTGALTPVPLTPY